MWRRGGFLGGEEVEGIGGRKGEAGTSGGGGQVEDGRLVVAVACLSAHFTVAGYLLVSVAVW